MALTKEEVQNVALLARISLDEQQLDQLHSELVYIFDHIDMLSTLDLEGVEPTVHAVPLCNVMREDELRPNFSVDTALANAPEREGSAFLVPRIVAPGGDA